MPLGIVYDDPAIVVVDKPVGLASIPERDLAVASVQRLLEAARGERLFVVHRLDKEVSGLLVFARSAEAHRALSIAFETRAVMKTYLALVLGTLADAQGVIEAPIHQFGSGRMGVDPRGKPSTTRYVVIARGLAAGVPTTLVHAHPETGRRHQLRVHFYHLGHPIAGDPRYGARDASPKFGRLMLHALRLTLPRPPGSSAPASPITLEAPADASFDALAPPPPPDG